MIFHFALCILFCEIFNGYCEKCTPFQYNSADISNDVFLMTRDIFHDLITSQINNTTAGQFESLYNKYKLASDNEDIYLNITQLLKKYGYPVEEHIVQTEDGYLLKMFRIPNDGPPVFLMNGLLCSSDDFVSVGPGKGLAYLLADAGYDVWLGNSRSNKHSRQHVKLSPACAEFWDYTWDEIGRYDTPAMIDYVLESTKEEQLIYIGFSRGNTVYYVMCSERPEYNAKIKVMIALSAVSFMRHCKSPIFQLLSPFNPLLEEIKNILGLYEFIPRNQLWEFITNNFCDTPALASLVCNNLFTLFFGLDLPQLNVTVLPVVFSHIPSGVATKEFIHYAQIMESGGFKQYDYGIDNFNRYGSLTPPEYPIEKITSPMIVFYSNNDWISPLEDILSLKRRLPNLVELIKVPHDKFIHTDFVFAKDVKELVYDELLEQIDKYTSN